MNQPAKPRTTQPPIESAESARSDWGLDVAAKRGANETRIGLLLVVCVVGALGYLTYRKVEERQHLPPASEFREPATDAKSTDSAELTPVGGQVILNAGTAGGWDTGSGDEPGSVDDSGSQPVAGSPDFLSLPAAQREPLDSELRTAGSDQTLQFLNEQFDGELQSQPETHPLASDSDWNAFAESTGLEPPRQNDDAEARPASVSGTLDSDRHFEEHPVAVSDWAENQETAPADRQGAVSSTADTSSNGEGRTDAAESWTNQSPSEPVTGLFRAGSESGAVAEDTVSVESDEGPLLEPLPVPADDARVIPVASDGAGGDFTRQAVVETSGGDPWTSETPRESAENSRLTVMDRGLGRTSSSPAADAATNPSSGAGFPPEVDGSTASVDAWNGGSNATSASTTPTFDPFSQSTATDVTLSVGTVELTVHVVQSGDNFWTIAHKYYSAGRFANALAAFNQARIPDPRKMRPGMKVLVPDRQVLVQQFPKLTGASYGPDPMAGAARPGFVVDRNGQPAYCVGKGDTLTSIAARHLGRASRSAQILGMNRDQLKDANSLKIGMVLRLPLDATQVSIVTGAAAVR